jgi:hypothetical protein
MFDELEALIGIYGSRILSAFEAGIKNSDPQPIRREAGGAGGAAPITARLRAGRRRNGCGARALEVMLNALPRRGARHSSKWRRSATKRGRNPGLLRAQ